MRGRHVAGVTSDAQKPHPMDTHPYARLIPPGLEMMLRQHVHVWLRHSLLVAEAGIGQQLAYKMLARDRLGGAMALLD